MLWIVSAVAALVTNGLLFAVEDPEDMQASLKALLQAWEAQNPHTTAVGRLRALLAAVTWLGRLRPAAPRDPLTECGMPPAGDGWWTPRTLPECLEKLMADERDEDSLFKMNLLSVAIIAVHLLACVLFLVANVPQHVPGISLSRGVLLRNAVRLAKKGHPRRHFLKHVPGILRLKRAAMAALSRRRRQKAGEKVSHDSMDWWREDDDGRGKLVVHPKELFCEQFRPYPYLKPRPKERVSPRRDLPLPHQGGQCPCAAGPPWTLVVPVLTLLLQVYLCVR